MTSTTAAATDLSIQQNVQEELGWSPDVESAGIAVAVDRGTVTLSGEVDDLAERRAAGRAALRTIGVGTVVDDLTLRGGSYVWQVPDELVAQHVAEAIRAGNAVSASIRATVDDHTVTLSGEVEWQYQRENAGRAVGRISGVAGVVNDITLHPRASATDTDTRIRRALIRSATLDAAAVHVEVAGNTVTLSGEVRSFAERGDAQRAAWSSPHVTEVIDLLTVTA